jgi:ligand-binding sensor domain-containing protein
MKKPSWVRPATILGLALLAWRFSPPRQDNLDRYRPGDWVSYGMSNYVSSVAVGPQHTYFGTTAGILRYDAVRGRWDTPMTTSDGIGGNLVTVVGFDPFISYLWCATDQGLSRQHPASQRWTNFPKIELGLPQNEDVVSIGFDQETNWFETNSGRLFRQDKFGNIILPAEGVNPGNQIVWFGVRRKPDRLPLPQFFMPAGFLFDPGRAMFNNINFIAYGTVQDNRLRRAPVTSAINDTWGNMWLGTWGLGALRADLNVDRAEVLQFGLANSRVDALLLEDQGLWIGGLHLPASNPADESIQGITHWSNPRPGISSNLDWRYFDARLNLDMSSDAVHNFVSFDKKIYCATEYGINIYDPKRDRWRRLTPRDGLADDRVNDVLAYDGNLYAATDLGLNRIALNTIGKDSVGIREISPDLLRHVRIWDLERQHNLLWLGTERGPFIYDMAKNTGGYLDDSAGPSDQPAISISFSDSVVWIGTDYGLDAFDVLHATWLGAPARRQFGDGQINVVKAGPEVVWVGTNNGVFKYHRGHKEWKQYSSADGLLDNHVNAIAMDDELVWFGTLQGLTAFRWRAYQDFE